MHGWPVPSSSLRAVSGTCKGRGWYPISDSAAPPSFRTLTGLFFCEAEKDVDSVFFDIVFSNCGVLLTMLLSKVKENILKVRATYPGGPLGRAATPPSPARESGARADGLPLMAERSRSGGAVPCPSSNVDCRSPFPTPLLSAGPGRMPRGQRGLRGTTHLHRDGQLSCLLPPASKTHFVGAEQP